MEFQLQLNEYSGLISFRIDWFDLLAVQGTLKSLLQHYSLKASILQRSAFFTVHLSHPYMTTGKTRALAIQTLLAKCCLCFLICCIGLSYLTFLGARVSKNSNGGFLPGKRASMEQMRSASKVVICSFSGIGRVSLVEGAMEEDSYLNHTEPAT